MTLDQVEAELRNLLEGEFSSLIIGFNEPSACNYCSVERFETEYSERDDDWISEEERRKGYDTNSKWTVQWHTNTPVGFTRVAASTLSAAIEAALPEQ